MTPDKTKSLQELITLFKNNIKQYKSNSYDEAKTRLEFIDKFFELLDWDVRNTAKSENDKKLYQQKIDIIDKQIDSLVYELYGLTDEDIKIVEEE